MKKTYYNIGLVGITLLVVLIFSSLGWAKTKISCWYTHGGRAGEVMRETVELYEKTHSDIEIELVYGGGLHTDPQKFMVALAAGMPPDMAFCERGVVGEWAARGAFRPLGDLFQQYGMSGKDFVHAPWIQIVYEGKIYAVPYYMSTFGIVWNKDLFAKAGLNPDTPPKYWDDLKTYASKLTIRDDTTGRITQLGATMLHDLGQSACKFYTFAWQLNGQSLSEDLKRCLINDSKWIRALRFMLEMEQIQGGAEIVDEFSTATEVFKGFDPFMMGKVGMYTSTGLWRFGNFAKYTPDINVGAGITPYPKDGRPVSFLGGWSFIIPEGARHPKEAFDFITFVISQERMAEFQRIHGNFPSQVKNIEYNMVHVIPEQTYPDQRQTFVELIKISQTYPPSPFATTVWDEIIRANQRGRYGEMSVEEALNSAAARVQEVINKYWGK